jgi:uncharacterized Ntn-hydrolase superfamily protein
MSSPFAPSRADGRSDRQVIFDVVAEAEPETVFTYEALIEALSAGLDETVDRRRVYRAITNANKTLLHERSRYLSVVKNTGYRVLRADEHLPAAIDRKQSAVSKLKQGMELLRNAKIEELDEAQRVLHQGQLMIMSGLYDAVRESHRRHDKQERVIEDLRDRQRADIEELSKRLDRIEGTTE